MFCSMRLPLHAGHALGYRGFTTEMISCKLKLSSQDFTAYKFGEEHFLSVCNAFQKSEFFSITHSPNEFSVIAASHIACTVKPLAVSPNWKMVYIEGCIPFDVTGVMLSVVAPLSAKNISLLATSSFDSDFFFFQKKDTDVACLALQNAGFPLEIE